MTANFLSETQKKRELDVFSIENALIDLLIKGSDGSLSTLGMTKGVMQLVDKDIHHNAMSKLGQLSPEVELGGSAANVLRGMAILGSKTSYSSAVGADAQGQSFIRRLQELNIENHLAILGDQVTGSCLVVVTPDGERTLNTHLGACVTYSKHHVPVDAIQRSKIFFTTGYTWDTDNQKEAINFALQTAKEAHVKIALDVADPFVVERSRQDLQKMITQYADVVFANADEAMMLVGLKGEKAAKALGESVEIACVKDGANGAFISYQGGIVHVPAPKVVVVDTTGAGDMFAGGFLHGLVNGLPLQMCGQIATTLAAHTITDMGVRLPDNITEHVARLK